MHFFTRVGLAPYQAGHPLKLLQSWVTDSRAFIGHALRPICASKGVPRLEPLEEKPWGLREFAVIDPDGNLLRHRPSTW